MSEPKTKPVNSIRDNFGKGTVGDFLKLHIKPKSDLSFVTAYFTIYAYERLRSELGEINSLRLLFGEPRFIKNVSASTEPKNYIVEKDKLVISPDNRLKQKLIAQQCAEWIRNKVEIKSMVKPDFLHGKLYHIKKQNSTEEAITGSSNFTVNGLGLGTMPNIELNLVVNDKRDLTDLKSWFGELWNNEMDNVEVENVKESVLKYIEQLYRENDPEFVYFKTLYHIFAAYLQEQDKGGLITEKTGFYDTQIWNMLYDFQKDGVKGAINKILKYNGCIIADSVGLGKTFEALAVIKYFELLGERVLVLCPKKLSHNWRVYQANKSKLNPIEKDRLRFKILYHTDMGRISGSSEADGIPFKDFPWNIYDLIVIDESHNFRGNPMDKTKDDGSVRMNRAKWLMDKIIKTGIKTKVLMLSATPVNTNLRDLRNQIYFITEGKPDALKESVQIEDIGNTLKTAQERFTRWADKDNPDRKLKSLLEALDSSFFKLLDTLTIARSRSHIKSFYKSADFGKFPERAKPISIYPDIDLKKRFPSYDELNKRILSYKLSVFNPSAYIKEAYKEKYEQLAASAGVLNFKQSKREEYLIAMMKINYLKRLESSIKSFEVSMARTIGKIKKLEEKIKKFQNTHVSKEETLESQLPGEDEQEEGSEDQEQWQIGKKLKFNLADLNLKGWLGDLENDRIALSELQKNAANVTPKRDAKLRELKEMIWDKLKCDNRKVIIFTAYADTAKYLYDYLQKPLFKVLNVNIALVTGSETHTSFGANDFDAILTNFAPLAKERANRDMKQDGEIDVLVATDCISEGQNLQDCDMIINYDIHWNPVRIIQRYGRIDRLGTKNEIIQLVNFWPTQDLDAYINLKERVEARMALVDVTATGEDNILNTEQIEELIGEDLKFRNKQLKKLKDEVLDLEEMNEGLSLTDFTLDDFRFDLIKYIEKNKEKLEDAPFGLYAVVPAPGGEHARHLNDFTAEQKDIIRPGVVFCLKQKGDTKGNEAINPLQPYFLVYIRDDGTVRYQYTHAKQILDMYRLMCLGKTQPYEELCDLFNKETEGGEKMDGYVDLLAKAANEISILFRKRAGQKLTSDRGALLIPFAKQLNEMNDFELVTWLIIK